MPLQAPPSFKVLSTPLACAGDMSSPPELNLAVARSEWSLLNKRGPVAQWPQKGALKQGFAVDQLLMNPQPNMEKEGRKTGGVQRGVNVHANAWVHWCIGSSKDGRAAFALTPFKYPLSIMVVQREATTERSLEMRLRCSICGTGSSWSCSQALATLLEVHPFQSHNNPDSREWLAVVWVLWLLDIPTASALVHTLRISSQTRRPGYFGSARLCAPSLRYPADGALAAAENGHRR